MVTKRKQSLHLATLARAKKEKTQHQNNVIEIGDSESEVDSETEEYYLEEIHLLELEEMESAFNKLNYSAEREREFFAQSARTIQRHKKNLLDKQVQVNIDKTNNHSIVEYFKVGESSRASSSSGAVNNQSYSSKTLTEGVLEDESPADKIDGATIDMSMNIPHGEVPIPDDIDDNDNDDDDDNDEGIPENIHETSTGADVSIGNNNSSSSSSSSSATRKLKYKKRSNLVTFSFARVQLEVAVEKLKSTVSVTPNQRLEKRTSAESKSDFMRKVAIQRLLERLLEGEPCQAAAQNIAVVLFGAKGEDSYRSRVIVSWTKYFVLNGTLPEMKQGRSQKTDSLLNDEDVQDELVEYLRDLKPEERTVPRFQQHINETHGLVSLRTARRWLHILGFSYGSHIGIYFDGHEREDVVAYRKQFLDRIKSYLPRMRQWDGEDMNVLIPNPELGPEIAMVSQDESLFKSHDGPKNVWMQNGTYRFMIKNPGRGYHCSGFVCACHGLFSLVYLKIGKQHDGYWTCTMLQEQLEKEVIPKFEELHPGMIMLCLFDNSQNHLMKEPGTADVSMFPAMDGGKRVPNNLKPGYYFNESGAKVEQSFYRADGKAKGLDSILSERGVCILKLNNDQKKAKLCEFEDFQLRTGWLRKTLETKGHLYDNYPKFHCEFNFIERIWGKAKRYLRDNCKYNYADLVENVPIALSLENIPLPEIQRYYRGALRMMDCYRSNNMNPELAARAFKIFKHHRGISEHQLEELSRS
jgi:hypothetical protein